MHTTRLAFVRMHTFAVIYFHVLGLMTAAWVTGDRPPALRPARLTAARPGPLRVSGGGRCRGPSAWLRSQVSWEGPRGGPKGTAGKQRFPPPQAETSGLFFKRPSSQRHRTQEVHVSFGICALRDRPRLTSEHTGYRFGLHFWRLFPPVQTQLPTSSVHFGANVSAQVRKRGARGWGGPGALGSALARMRTVSSERAATLPSCRTSGRRRHR